jgi:hypothetical protein
MISLCEPLSNSVAGSGSVTITVDADPSTPGAQAGLNVPELSTFSVHVLISSVVASTLVAILGDKRPDALGHTEPVS